MSISNFIENAIGKNTSKTVRMNVVGSASPYFVDGRDFDCIVSINQSLTNTITSNPVEFGTPVTDNIYRNQRIYTLTGMLSPFSTISVAGVSVADVGIPSLSSQNNTQDWYAGLVELYNLTFGGLITLSVYPQSYPNLVIETLTFDDTYINGEGLKYSITLKEVIIASTSLSSGNTNNPSNPINNSSVNNGTVPIVNETVASLF